MQYTLNESDVASEVLDGEVILIHLTTGSYYSFQESGPEVWAALLAGWTVAEIAAAFAEAGQGDAPEIARHVEDFVQALLLEQLITPAQLARQPGPTLARGRSFVPPALQKYTDMQELLLVDPIHEVTEAGWPLKADAGK